MNLSDHFSRVDTRPDRSVIIFALIQKLIRVRARDGLLNGMVRVTYSRNIWWNDITALNLITKFLWNCLKNPTCLSMDWWLSLNKYADIFERIVRLNRTIFRILENNKNVYGNFYILNGKINIKGILEKING